MKSFIEGEFVKLKNGGEATMVVFELTKDGLKVVCKWQDKNHKPQQDIYPVDSLIHIQG